MGGGREGITRKKAMWARKAKTGKESLLIQKNAKFCSSHSTLKNCTPSPQHAMARLCEEQCSLTRQSAHLTAHSCQHSFFHSLYSPCASSSTGLLCKPAQLPACGRTLTSASSLWAGNSQPSWYVWAVQRSLWELPKLNKKVAVTLSWEEESRGAVLSLPSFPWAN